MMKVAVDKAKLDSFFKSLEKEYGEGSMYTLDSKHATLQIPRWSTGIEALDDILGGGLPFGRVIEIFGAEGSAKTSLGYHLMAQHEAAIDIAVEGTFDAGRAKMFGNREGQLFVRRANTGEQCFEVIDKAVECGMPIIVVDSVPHMITEKEFDEDDYTKEVQPGRIAALMAKRLPKTSYLVEKNKTTLIFINQLRDAMNKTFFMPDDHTPGGRCLKFACSVRLQLQRKEDIKIPNKNPKNTAQNIVVGMIIKVKVKKSKINNPHGECEIPLFFDRGFVSFDEVESIRQELMLAQRKPKVVVEEGESVEEVAEDKPKVKKKKK
jgi:recombination protein RecA